MIWAILGALCMGLSLGLLGSGGSILTVPLLLGLGHADDQAIAESLGIVGSIALAGAIPYAAKRLVDWRSVFFFGLSGMAGAWTGSLIGHQTSGTVRLAVFAIVMLVAAVMMVRGPKLDHATRPHREHHILILALEGLFVGMLTGFVGVGGGFMIVPALVLLGGLPMRSAVATSLCIIAINAFTGFASQAPALAKLGLRIDWNTVIIFIVVGVVGSFAGNMIGGKINQHALRRIFGYFLVVMGLWILVRQGRKLVQTPHDSGILKNSTHQETWNQAGPPRLLCERAGSLREFDWNVAA